jgi:hypothetical protein
MSGTTTVAALTRRATKKVRCGAVAGNSSVTVHRLREAGHRAQNAHAKRMMFTPQVAFGRRLRAGLGLASVVLCAHGAEPTAAQLEELLAQNRRLQQQVEQQARTIELLRGEIGAVRSAGERQERELRGLQERVEGAGGASAAAAPVRNRDREVRISGEAGFAFFKSGSAGSFPNAEFRVDDAKIFLEAPVRKDTYLFAGLELTTREANDEYFHVGELYVDFENVAARWGLGGALTFRAGRFNLPFGEEYQVRGVVDNPLISHSLADIWGIDEGVEIYGALGAWSYAVAVQNGGHKTLHDYNADKSVTARLSVNPARWLSLSASAMRTGELNAINDSMSEVWFGNGFFRSIGSAATTTNFAAELFELDASARWRTGHLKVAAGWARYEDDARGADNSRRMNYGAIEAMQEFGGGFHAAARYSAIRAPRGYPLVGLGDFGTFLFRSPHTTRLERTSLGFGYRLGPPIVLKLEYSWERGRMTNGALRDHENLLSTEIGMKF